MPKAQQYFNSLKKLKGSAYAEYLEKQKNSIVNFHINNNTFYHSLLNGNKYKQWTDLPVITKKELQQPLTNRLSTPYKNKKNYINKTSGSSGKPFIFAKDKWSHALTWSEFIDRYNWFNLDLNTSYQARFYGIPLNGLAHYKERLKDWLGNRYRFSVFNLSDEAFDSVLDKFRNSDFDYINGYTSPIVQFAKYLKKKHIILSEVCPTLKACIVTSEMLYDSDKTLLEEQFGLPIINEYGCAELGLIAFQNTKNEWQVNSETLFIEILDEDNKPVPNGTEGNIVITSLYNKAHPFIRYKVGDRGILSEDSTPEKPILKSLTGRTSDIIKLPSGKTSAGLTFYYVTKSVIEDNANVKEFIITQTHIDQFTISYVSNNELSEIDKQNVLNSIDTYLEKGLTITFERLEVLKRSKSGKLKQFTSKVL